MKIVSLVSRIMSLSFLLMLVSPQTIAQDMSSSDDGNVSDITIVTEDDVTLKGTYYAAAEPGPAVLFVHMCRSDADRTTWAEVATELISAGIHSLAIDLRGYGESSGAEPPFTTMANFISFWRTTGMNDIEAAHRFLNSQPGVLPQKIGYAGASCGVFIGIEAAQRFSNISALALLSGPFDDGAAATLSSLGAIPVLGASSEGDTRSYQAMKRVFLETTNEHSRNIQFKGDAHGTDMFKQQPDLSGEMVDWFKHWLLQ